MRNVRKPLPKNLIKCNRFCLVVKEFWRNFTPLSRNKIETYSSCFAEFFFLASEGRGSSGALKTIFKSLKPNSLLSADSVEFVSLTTMLASCSVDGFGSKIQQRNINLRIRCVCEVVRPPYPQDHHFLHQSWRVSPGLAKETYYGVSSCLFQRHRPPHRPKKANCYKVIEIPDKVHLEDF